MLWGIIACMTLTTATNASNDPSCETNMIYFQCFTPNNEFTFCKTKNGNFLLSHKMANKTTFLFNDKNRNLITHNNYHRFKAEHNTLTLENNEHFYELYEYSDEESIPAIHELGITVFKNKEDPKEFGVNYRCGLNSEGKLAHFINEQA